MTNLKLTDISIKQLAATEDIPYTLLLDADPSKECIEKYLIKSEIYVAKLGDEIIGVYVLYPINKEQAEIKNIAVEEKLQGKGVGKLLLEDAFKKAKVKGYKELIIGTGNSSVGQLYLYQKTGFEMAAIKWNFFIDNYPDPLYENGIRVKHMIVLSRKL
jgi:aminoglycoside 6'-N-acetyltransferase I